METENLYLQLKKQWYVAYTHSRSERKVAGKLAKLGVTFFLPMRKIITRSFNGSKELSIPMFSNYVFVLTSINRIPSLLRISEIERFVSFGDTPVPVSNEEIIAIRQACFPELQQARKPVNLSVDLSLEDGKPKRNTHIQLQPHLKNVA